MSNEQMIPYEHQMQIAGILTAWAEKLERAAEFQLKPHILYKPKLSKDGNMWCALYGSNLQEGVSGFGATPELAMKAFDREWSEGEIKEAAK